MDFHDLDTFTRAYITAALWASMDNADESGGKPLDANYGPEDLHPDALRDMVADCTRFQATQQADLTRWGDDEQAGIDFWLTRNGHGAGFWDRGRGRLGERLTNAAHAQGECHLVVGDDEKIHIL